MDPIERIRFKRLLTSLTSMEGDGTSMITLLLPPREIVSKINNTLTEEYGAASNIKSRVNRLSVLSAITSAQQKLKLYKQVPNKGLCLLVGTIVDGNDRKQVSLDFEPPKQLSTFLYRCDSKFHLEQLYDMLKEDKVFGALIMDGHGFLIARIAGNHTEVIYEDKVSLPPKHGRGGQSALRFARLRESARHNYLRKVSETMTKCFITNDLPNVIGLIIGGSADLKSDIQKKDFFDPRLLKIILKVVDVSYGGEQGLNEALNLSAEALASLDLLKEKQVLQGFFDLIAINVNKVVFGQKDSLRDLSEGLLDSFFIDENETTLEELLTIATEKNTKVYTISGNSAEGAQFIKGFGGWGGILRFERLMDEVEEDEWMDD